MFSYRVMCRCIALLCLVTGTAVAADLPLGVVAVVNGKHIRQVMVDVAVAQEGARGQADTPALRTAVLNDLVVAAMLADRARQIGVSNLPKIAAGLDVLETNFLARELQRFWVEKNPISNAELRYEYNRQVAELSKRGQLQEFQLSHIVVPDEARALQILSEVKAGADFVATATASSIDPSRERGGDMGWVLPFNILPEIGNVLVNLAPNTLAMAPIQTRLGWHVVKLGGKRDYTIPTFEASKLPLQQAVQNANWSAYLLDLNSKTNIQR